MNDDRHRLLRRLGRTLACTVPLLAFSLSGCHGFYYALHGYGHTRAYHKTYVHTVGHHHSGQIRVYRKPGCR